MLYSYMIRKLYALVSGECRADNPDSPQHQEILLPGHIYNMILKEKIFDWLTSIKTQIRTSVRLQPEKVDFFNSKWFAITHVICQSAYLYYAGNYILNTIRKVTSDLGKKLDYFLATGNLVSKTGLDLQQVWCVCNGLVEYKRTENVTFKGQRLHDCRGKVELLPLHIAL